jgi:uncharacterized protein with von Willebrand factor type A (vWA) domain
MSTIADNQRQWDQRAQNAAVLDAWRSVFEKTDRILSGRPVQVRVVSPEVCSAMGMSEVAGWTDGELISFNGEMVADTMSKEKDPVRRVLAMKGLNYHELSHVLYTPRMSDELPRRVKERAQQAGDHDWWYAFNALEDQRIETWFTSTYRPSRRYFEATVIQYLLANGNAEVNILLHGRKYLSPRLRAKVRKAFITKYDQNLHDEFASVIDDYLQVLLPVETVKALGLVKRFYELLQQMKARAPLPVLIIEDNCGRAGQMPGKGNDEDAIRKGRILQREAKDAREAAQRDMEKAADADEAEDAEDGEDGDGDQDGKPSKGTGEGLRGTGLPDAIGKDGTQPGKGNRSATDSQSPGQITTEDATGDPGGQGAGRGHVEHRVLERDEIKQAVQDMIDAAREAMEDVEADEGVRRDAEAVLDAVKAIMDNGRMNAQGDRGKRKESLEPTPEQQVTVRRVTNILSRIRADLEPQTMRRQVTGRIDPRRFMVRRPHEIDVFNAWDQGYEDETSIEVALLVDMSGSMSRIMADAAAALWALKRAFDKLEVRTTVIGFDDQHWILYQPQDKVQINNIEVYTSGGGTDPTSALQQAFYVLSKSHRPNKVLITITDGQWSSNDNDVAAIMKSLHKQGAVTCLLGLGHARRSGGLHHHETGHDIENIGELVKVATKIVSRIMQRVTTSV